MIEFFRFSEDSIYQFLRQKGNEIFDIDGSLVYQLSGKPGIRVLCKTTVS